MQSMLLIQSILRCKRRPLSGEASLKVTHFSSRLGEKHAESPGSACFALPRIKRGLNLTPCSMQHPCES